MTSQPSRLLAPCYRSYLAISPLAQLATRFARRISAGEVQLHFSSVQLSRMARVRTFRGRPPGARMPRGWALRGASLDASGGRHQRGSRIGGRGGEHGPPRCPRGDLCCDPSCGPQRWQPRPAAGSRIFLEPFPSAVLLPIGRGVLCGGAGAGASARTGEASSRG